MAGFDLQPHLDLEWAQRAAMVKTLQTKVSCWLPFCSYYNPGPFVWLWFLFALLGFFALSHQDLLHHWHWSWPQEAQPAGGCHPFPHWRGAWPGMWVPGTERALLGFSCTHHKGEGTVTKWLVTDWTPVALAETGRTELKPRLIHKWKWAEDPCLRQRIFFHFKADT